MAAKKLPFIPVQMPDKDAAFAGMQYQIETSRSSPCKHSKLYPLFRDTIRRLIYANFKWTGDITQVEARAIEFKLIETGRIIAVKSQSSNGASPNGVFFGMMGTPDSPDDPDTRTDPTTGEPLPTFDTRADPHATLTYDFYGQPSAASCTGINGVMFTADSNNFVLGFDTMCTHVMSPMTAPIISYIGPLAANLDNAYSAWRVAVETNKLGMVFDAPDDTSGRLLKRVLERVSENDPFVITRGNMSTRSDVLYRPGTQTAIGAFYQNLLNAWSLVMDVIGVENESSQKRERMVVDEAMRTNSLAKAIGYDRLHARQLFAEEVSRKLGKHIEVQNAYTAMLNESDANGADNSTGRVQANGTDN